VRPLKRGKAAVLRGLYTNGRDKIICVNDLPQQEVATKVSLASESVQLLSGSGRADPKIEVRREGLMLTPGGAPAERIGRKDKAPEEQPARGGTGRRERKRRLERAARSHETARRLLHLSPGRNLESGQTLHGLTSGACVQAGTCTCIINRIFLSRAQLGGTGHSRLPAMQVGWTRTIPGSPVGPVPMSHSAFVQMPTIE